ncbi:hypothetical protein [Sphingomonas sp. DT-204]|uniref:hypothetical protein n=1 Tax=Sphingomonas sp. DT-204 TaxID=3396166 RepID=UPI003F1E07E6
MTEACFLQVKAFGDLVIANAAAERVAEADRGRLTLAIGEHLRPLCEAIEPKIRVVELATVETGVPSIFDARRNGMLAAVKSAWHVRRAIERAPLDRSTLLLLDRLNWRERFVVGGRPATGMAAGTSNIYEGYDRLLADNGFQLRASTAAPTSGRRRLGIFPGSRIAAKNLPPILVSEIMRESERAGMSTSLFLLEGERPDLEAGGLPHVMVPRQFKALRDAIASMDVVISADSLPAHLAESLAIEVFVLTPRPNEFWMPHSVFEKRRWSLFDDPDRLSRLRAMLAP